MTVTVNRAWMKTYEKLGLEYHVHHYPAENTSIIDILEDSCQKFSKRDAFYFMGKSMTYAEFDTYSLQVASYLQSLGLNKGDRVAVMLPNVLQ